MNRKTKQFVATLVLLGLIVLHSVLIPRARLAHDIAATNTADNFAADNFDSSAFLQASARTRAPLDFRTRPAR